LRALKEEGERDKGQVTVERGMHGARVQSEEKAGGKEKEDEFIGVDKDFK